MSGIQPTLSNHLGVAKYSGTYLARVDLALWVDSGRVGQPNYPVSILVPRPVQQLFWSSTKYALSIGDGHVLNPDGEKNRIDIVKLRRTSAPAINRVTFSLPLNGDPLVADDGVATPYVAALSSGGPAIFRSPGYLRPANAFFSDNDDLGNEDPSSWFAVLITARDHDNDTTITVTPVSTSGGGVTLQFELEDAESYKTVINTGTVVPGGPPFTFTFDREATAGAIIDARHTALNDAWMAEDPQHTPLIFESYFHNFVGLQALSPAGGGSFGYLADSGYPYSFPYRLEQPHNEYNVSPYRPDLHFGNENDAPPGLPAEDRWIRHKVISMDVNVVRAVRLTAGPSQKRGHFQ